jgi:hypothetical protein
MLGGVKYKKLSVLLFVLIALGLQYSKQTIKIHRSLTLPKNMEQFMGMAWGINVKEFLESFKIKKNLKKITTGFRIEKFKHKRNFMNINFLFENNKNTGSIYNDPSKWEFKKVEIVFNSNSFDAVYEDFRRRYGYPVEVNQQEFLDNKGFKKNQVIIKWINLEQTRKITAHKYSKGLKNSLIIFDKFNQ